MLPVYSLGRTMLPESEGGSVDYSGGGGTPAPYRPPPPPEPVYILEPIEVEVSRAGFPAGLLLALALAGAFLGRVLRV